jgi:tetratricopeptide (TPR) repeat protein
MAAVVQGDCHHGRAGRLADECAIADKNKRQASKIRDVSKVGLSVNHSYKSRFSSETWNSLYLRGAFSVIAALISMLTSAAAAQQAYPQHSDGVTIRGNVLNLAGKSVGDASVRLEQKGALKPVETKTDAAGVFVFTALPTGRYLLSAEKSGLRSHGTAVLALSEGDQKNIDLILEAVGDIQSNSNVSSPSPSQTMEFSDKPNFTIAGVTDWTAVGGHGSDSTLRTSEDLARETLTLKPEDSGHNESGLSGGASGGKESESKLRAALARAPESFEGNHQLGEFYLRAGRYQDSIPLLQTAYQTNPTMDGNAYDLALAYKHAGDFSQARELVQKLLEHKDTADLHHLAGELDEKLGDPLAAVQEDEHAVRLDPSEQNYFEWGSELLLHRAVWQAVEVFKDGAKAYPKSPRMLTALGTALFAGALYDEAAIRLCSASDLNPTDPEPYIFMGKIEMAAPTSLPCVEQKLARFVQEQSQNPLANYLYAMAIWKRQEQPADQRALQQVETLLTKAVTIDPNCVDANLQLGILYSSQRDYEKAIGFYTKAIEVDPQLGEAHYRLGVAYDRTGEPAKAKRELLLHDEIEKQQAATVERQRREIKQFLIVLHGQPAYPTAQ